MPLNAVIADHYSWELDNHLLVLRFDEILIVDLHLDFLHGQYVCLLVVIVHLPSDFSHKELSRNLASDERSCYIGYKEEESYYYPDEEVEDAESGFFALHFKRLTTLDLGCFTAKCGTLHPIFPHDKADKK